MNPNKYLSALLVASSVILAGCEKEAETYPITGEQCGPEDPVKTLDAEDCYIPPAVN
ncbi:hypothetical protein [Ruegeria conchae]|uniref:Lipoprotein n=1 Tax=Ruegeria conchae TaxID=981384 RepID=A0A497YWP9_9RHOB|nr:hypothetical protein [Ruegeria conchae]RLK00471.1 hypothetical protein CLV75_3461 [Ruegeria conchae]